jgi:hypothetical protein
MKRQSTSAKKAAIIPFDQAALERFVPDLAQWPTSWRVDDNDLPVGQCIVDHLRPFLIDLLHQPITDKTRRRHRDHLWMLGGELIRRRHDDPERMRQSVPALLERYVEEDGGPLLWPRISEAQQNAFDATCRKLFRFLDALKASKRA